MFRYQQNLEQSVEVIKVILQEQCQRVRLFSFDSVWEGGCGLHRKSVCCPTPHPHTRGLILSGKRWSLEHVVLDLYSRITMRNMVTFGTCASARCLD